MSGIAGIIHFNGAAVEPGLIEKMTAAMHYRGPDGIHHWVEGSVAVGQCMLCTTPESLEEHQPVTNENEGLVLVMDGRIDNWVELRKILLEKGAALRNHTDAELVLRSYELWGESCLNHLDGDFALVIWNACRQEVFCARDPMGSKSFHYHWDGNTFSFATELHAIQVLPWITKKINEGVLAEFLAAEWYSLDETLWSEILRLRPAHLLIINKRNINIKQYWEPDPWLSFSYSKDEEYFEHYRELVFQSVKRHSRSYKTVSIEVSGGLDSSAVFCIAEHLRSSNDLPAPSIKGYTIDFTGDKNADELFYAQAVGKFLNVQIDEVLPSRMPLSWLDDRSRENSYFPGFANSNMANNMLEKASLTGSRVIMNGIGGDEWLAGSRLYYSEELAKLHWDKFYESFQSDTSAYGVSQSLKWVVRHGFLPLLPLTIQNHIRQIFRQIRGITNTHDLFWLSPVMKAHIKQKRERYILRKSEPVFSKSQRNLFQYLNDAYAGFTSEDGEVRYARLGLECRQPLNTKEIVQFAFSTPERLRLRGDSNKYIHVQALQNFLPAEIFNRRTGAEFSSMFREHLDQMSEVFNVTLPLGRSDWVTKEGMNELFKHYKDNPQSGWSQWVLWSIYGCDRFL